VSQPEPITTSHSQILFEGVEVIAKHRGQTVQEFFKANPQDYKSSANWRAVRLGPR